MTTTDVTPAGAAESAPPGSLLPTLPGRYYTDPDVFAREQTRVFEAMWCCAVRSAELADPGSFRRVQVGRESVLVVRGGDGELPAFLNVCRHRGAVLCTEESGQTKRTLRCPYHAWSYGLDGALVGAPNLRNMPDVDRVAHGLVPVQLREWPGYAWVCLADEPPSFEREVQGAVTERLGDPAAIEGYGVERLTLGRRIRYDVRANWKLIVENFMECYHCATIHPELTHVLPEFARGYAAQSFVGHGAEFALDTQGFTVDGSAGFPVLPGVGADQDRRYYAATIKPTVFLNLVPDHVIVLRMTPLDRRFHAGGVRLVVRARGGLVRLGCREIGRAVPPGQPAGLRRLRAHPARDELQGSCKVVKGLLDLRVGRSLRQWRGRRARPLAGS